MAEVTHRAFKFPLDPTDAQRVEFSRHVGMNRSAFNFALELKNRQMEKRNAHIKSLIDSGETEEQAKAAVKGLYKIPGKMDLEKVWNWVRDTRDWNEQPVGMKIAPNEFQMTLITDWIEARKEDEEVRGAFPWQDGLNAYAAKSALSDADAAYKNYFDSLMGKRKGKKVGRPKFKKKGRATDSYKLFHDKNKPTIRLEGYHRLNLPTVGSVKIMNKGLARKMARLMKRAEGKIISATVSRSADRWYVSVLVEVELARLQVDQVSSKRPGVGLDVGVVRMGTLSDGTVYNNLRAARKSHKKLAEAQRALARTQKGSNRRARAVQRVAKIHHKVALQRANAQHQMTSEMVRRYSKVVIEDLKVSSMSKSAKGTVESPGKNVKAKSGLNRSLLDVGFGEIRRQLEYKGERRGVEIVAVNPAYTSRTCSECGHVDAKSRESQARFACTSCGHTSNADLNAARNIYKKSGVTDT